MSSVRIPLVSDAAHPEMMPFTNADNIRAYILDSMPRINMSNTGLVANITGGLVLPDGKPIAGIIGTELWRNTTIRLDFAAKTLNVCTLPHAPLHLPDATMLPLKFDKSCYFVTLPMDAEHTCDFLLDSGAPVTEVPPAVARALKVRNTSVAYSECYMGCPTVYLDFGFLPGLPVGMLTARDLGVAYFDNEKAIGRAVIGMNLMSRYRLTFDFSNNQLHLEPGANYADVARVVGYPVVRISRKAAETRVRGVLPGSAAYRAGVRKGDVLLSVDDVPTQNLIETATQGLLNGYGGTQARLKVQRDGRTETMTYTRYSLTVAATTASTGLTLQLSATGRFVVGGAEKGSPAYLAGVRKTDEILAIDGQSVEATDYEALLEALNNPKTSKTSLIVVRKGETEPHQAIMKRQ